MTTNPQTTALEVASDFCAERPIESRSQDLLDRRIFAEALAGAIARWEGQDSLVIGLYGDWGSGKTSIKNMALEALSQDWKNENVRVVGFNPWQFSTRIELFEGFFRELGAILGSSHFSTEADRRHALAMLKKYKAYLKLGATFTDTFKTAGLWGLITLSVIQPVLAYIRPWASLAFGLITAGMAVLLMRLPKVLDAMIEAASAKKEADAKPLETLKGEIAKSLKKLDGTLLVVVDDIDRLRRDQMDEMFQLVKINADFPRVVYLLLFDRGVVEQVLGGTSARYGRQFVEKIVQVSFTVPAVGAADTDEALRKGIAAILEKRQLIGVVDQVRWDYMLALGVGRYFATMRHVYRFLSSLSFSLGALCKRRPAECRFHRYSNP